MGMARFFTVSPPSGRLYRGSKCPRSASGTLTGQPAGSRRYDWNECNGLRNNIFGERARGAGGGDLQASEL